MMSDMRGARISTRLTAEEYRELREKAAQTGIGPSTFARLLIQRGLGAGPTDVGRGSDDELAEAIERLDRRLGRLEEMAGL